MNININKSYYLDEKISIVISNGWMKVGYTDTERWGNKDD